MSDPLTRHDIEASPLRLHALAELLGGTEFDVIAGIDISTSTGVQGDNPLTATGNEIVTSGIGKACTLPGCAVGLIVAVFNTSTGTIRIYPASGDDLGLGTDTRQDLSADSWSAWMGVTSTLWRGATGTMI